MTKPSGKKVLSIAAITMLVIPAAAHAGFVKSAEMKREAELARMTEVLAPLAGSTAVVGMHVVDMNGSKIGFKTTTVDQPIDAVMKSVESECRSGKIEQALAGVETSTLEGINGPEIELAHYDTQDEAHGDVRASLCTFAAEQRQSGEQPMITGGKGDLPRVRYTLANKVDDKTTHVITIVNASSTPLEQMFPAEGDAPGSDMKGVARPENSKRTLTAKVDGAAHEVRMYETPMAIGEAMKSYDGSMKTLGWENTSSLPEARMYRRDGESVIASFLTTSDGTNVSIAPFDPPKAD